jgi:hypothetical protein
MAERKCRYFLRETSHVSIDRLYKYGRINEYSEALFSTAQVWFSSPAQLNDPFECRPWLTFKGTQEQIVNRLAGVLRKQNSHMTQHTATAEAVGIFLEGRHRDPRTWEGLREGVIRNVSAKTRLYCLSRVPDSILMWSHYASDHQGYCLEFEATDNTVVFGEALPVIYSDDYPSVDYFSTPKEKQPELIFRTKYTGWVYEQEWRIIDFETGPGLRDYPPELLKGVIFGLRMSDENKARIREWVGRREHVVQFYQAVRHDRKFSIEVQEIP